MAAIIEQFTAARAPLQVGEVTPEGKVIQFVGDPQAKLMVGDVTREGFVWKKQQGKRIQIGFVTRDGVILKATPNRQFSVVGLVTSEGLVRKGRAKETSKPVGQVGGAISIEVMGGAALILLLSP